MAGRNEELARRFDKLAAGAPRFRPYRFVQNIEVLMNAACVVVTKSGGLTTSECLALGKPMIIAFVERHQTEVVQRILRHCGLWEESRARRPPAMAGPVQD